MEREVNWVDSVERGNKLSESLDLLDLLREQLGEPLLERL